MKIINKKTEKLPISKINAGDLFTFGNGQYFIRCYFNNSLNAYPLSTTLYTKSNEELNPTLGTGNPINNYNSNTCNTADNEKKISLNYNPFMENYIDNLNICYAVNLISGEVEQFSAETKVMPVEAELVLPF